MKCPLCAATLGAKIACPDCGYEVPEKDRTKPDREFSRPPRAVRIAVLLLAVTAGLEALRIANAWWVIGLAAAAASRTQWYGPVMLSLRVLLIWMLWRRKTWARTVLLILIALATGSVVATVVVLHTFNAGGLSGGLSWAALALQLYAVFLLFRNESLDWFR